MPNGGRRRRTNRESEVFKSEIINLRTQKKSIVEIANELNVSKQYVSQVLIKAGLRVELREKRLAIINDKRRAKEEELAREVSRLEEQGDYALAIMLQVLAKRRKR